MRTQIPRRQAARAATKAASNSDSSHEVVTSCIGYLFFRTKKKDIDPVNEEMAAKSSSVTAPVTVEKTVSSTVVAEPVVVKAREPIPEKQQRELFKWMLEEKRKVNPKNAEEKKRNDQEKAILKQFIGSKTIPTL
ncbi:unnamed protein product [Arabidopsis arenosa]|uniref:Uncharacterized protein n=1 Tax=Arabidopsis arenosa TaxID=38785 RepID=A0A8S2ATH9_ARAAE|nr:unnamed protein product [Arabidopsis arenosa]